MMTRDIVDRCTNPSRLGQQNRQGTSSSARGSTVQAEHMQRRFDNVNNANITIGCRHWVMDRRSIRVGGLAAWSGFDDGLMHGRIPPHGLVSIGYSSFQ
jgi:hypothetical protein